MGLAGMDFKTAGSRVLELFQHRGWSAILNDRLLNRVLLLGQLVVSGLVALAVSIALRLQGASVGEQALFGGVTGIVSLALSLTIITVVEGGVATVFVCFAMDGGALASSHPESFTQLTAAWRQAHPDLDCSPGAAPQLGSWMGMTMLGTAAMPGGSLL
jgi:hypothetical protein